MGEIPVFLLEAGDQPVIFLVPLGDTVYPLFFWLTVKWADCALVCKSVVEGVLEQDGQKKKECGGILCFHFWLQVVLRHGS